MAEMNVEISREALHKLSAVCSDLKNRLERSPLHVMEQRSFWDDWVHKRAQKKSIKNLQPQLQLIVVGIQDALKHPVALVGYLDGFEARSRFNEYILSRSPDIPTGELQLVTVKHFVVEGLALLERVFGELADRAQLRLSPNGPSKPGPQRTLELAHLHLEALFLKVDAVFKSDAQSKQRR